MNKDIFKKVFNEGKTKFRDYMIVRIETEGNPDPEYIINPSGNFDQKYRYYMEAYNDDMELIKAKENGKLIKITHMRTFNSLHIIPTIIKNWEEASNEND